MEICNEIFINLLKLISKQKKNVIIDQCNVLLRSRLEKMALFPSHYKEAIVFHAKDRDIARR